MSEVTTVEREVPRIEAALHQTLTAIHQADQNVGPREPISARDSLGQYLQKRVSFTPLQLEVDDLLERPVGEALRQKVRLYGERLFEIGGVSLMQEVMYRVAERDPANEARRIGIMDKRWNGIGQGSNSTGWVA
jgi:hypothetical protein